MAYRHPGAFISAAALSLWCLASTGEVSTQQPPLPPALESYVTTVARLDRSERNSLSSGAPVTKLLDADASKEVAALGAVWIRAEPSAYVERVMDIEHFEQGPSFPKTRRISRPPQLSDFADLELSAEDLADLRACRIGDCQLKLGERGLEMLREEVDWTKTTAKADALTAFRRLALEYVIGYERGGNAALAVYRDSERPTFVANEFRALAEQVPPLVGNLPELKRYLLEYPRAPLSDSREFIYWQETHFGLKPTIRINHLVVQQRPEQTVVASKMLYASHYFWTALELRVLIPDAARGPGFWLVTINRSRSDGLSGFVGRFVRGRVRSEVRRGTLAVLKATKAALETSTP